MNAVTAANITERVGRIETMPSIPAVLLPLLDMLNAPPDRVKLDEVVKLVSYDNTIALQTLRVASSPLFGLARAPQSVKSAVISLGLRKVQTILLTCCLGQAFPVKNWPLQPSVFWRHSLACAMVCRKICERLASADGEQAYMAGLLHDIGFMVNCLAFPREFTTAVELASREQMPLFQAEQEAMGFTHCESGRALAERWHLHKEIVQVIAFHHSIEQSESAQALVSLVHIADLLCRMRNLGYGYYERHKADLIHDPAWLVISRHHRELEGIDLVRFTFELDEAVVEIDELVSTILGSGRAV
jgi:putative nucleotidyltransferase with HDIG domain